MERGHLGGPLGRLFTAEIARVPMNRRYFSCLSAALIACGLIGCGNTDAPPRDYGPLLSKLSEGIILPEHRAFVTRADALANSVQSLIDDPNADSLASAQRNWRATRSIYRALDALHFGPGYTLHITERIDVGPATPEDIEALAASDADITDTTITRAGGHEKGFLGLEYLLFPDLGANADSLAPVLAKDELAERRRALALAMAHEIANSAHQLDNAWEPDGDGYTEQFTSAGAGSKQYTTQRAAVDDAVGGVAYALELITGIRLAEPLGRKSGGTPDPSLDPTLRSDSAVADMRATLDGIVSVYSGDGFSSVVRSKSATLDQTVRDDLTNVDLALQDIPPPFADAVVNDTEHVKAAYDVAVDLKKTWNTDVSSTLGATVKFNDPDGD